MCRLLCKILKICTPNEAPASPIELDKGGSRETAGHKLALVGDGEAQDALRRIRRTYLTANRLMVLFGTRRALMCVSSWATSCSNA
jgi:hypothetical protein